ncbi:putative bifunctional diguanylate cyclase/phosphodiesterase [Halomonas cibimaris]
MPECTKPKSTSPSSDEATANVFAQANEALIITDADNRITHVNPAFIELTGLSLEDVYATTPNAFLLFSRDAGDGAALVEDEVRRYGTSRCRVTYRRRDGERYPGVMSVKGVRNALGTLVRHVIVLADLSLVSQMRPPSCDVDYDALTGLPGLKLLTRLIQDAIEHADRSGQALAVCTLDIDFFSRVNETFSRRVGDGLLTDFARRIGQLLCDDDVLARVGGDEFVLLVRQNADEAFFQRLLAVIRKPLMVEGKRLYLSASMGVTRYPADKAQGDVLLRHANQAMYRAKQRGRDSFHIFDSEHDRWLQVRNEQRQRFFDALENNELRLHYQPQVDLQSGRVIGVEALIRWQHPDRGLLSPAAFLPIIDGTLLEVDLGEWVLDAALRQLADWHQANKALAISVNISPTHLLTQRFTERLGELLARYPQVSPALLKLEVLESAALHDIQTALDTMARCRALGVSFAVDDFGTGFSSLTHLRKLPVNLIKVDQSFVRDMLVDPDDMAIVESVIYMANRFCHPMMAEGVETLDHARALMSLGCMLAQGYGIARPMPPEALPEWLLQWPLRREWRDITAAPVA